MGFAALRWGYRLLWTAAQEPGAPASFIYGFYNRHPHPDQVPDCRLEAAIDSLRADVDRHRRLEQGPMVGG